MEIRRRGEEERERREREEAEERRQGVDAQAVRDYLARESELAKQRAKQREQQRLLLSPTSSQSSDLPPGPDIGLGEDDEGKPRKEFSDEDYDPNDPEPSEGSIYQSDWGSDFGR